jgi:hypothetical protein
LWLDERKNADSFDCVMTTVCHSMISSSGNALKEAEKYFTSPIQGADDAIRRSLAGEQPPPQLSS